MKPAIDLKNESARSQELILEFAKVINIAAEKITKLETENKKLNMEILNLKIENACLKLSLLAGDTVKP